MPINPIDPRSGCSTFLCRFSQKHTQVCTHDGDRPSSGLQPAYKNSPKGIKRVVLLHNSFDSNLSDDSLKTSNHKYRQIIFLPHPSNNDTRFELSSVRRHREVGWRRRRGAFTWPVKEIHKTIHINNVSHNRSGLGPDIYLPFAAVVVVVVPNRKNPNNTLAMCPLLLRPRTSDMCTRAPSWPWMTNIHLPAYGSNGNNRLIKPALGPWRLFQRYVCSVPSSPPAAAAVLVTPETHIN